MRIDGPSPCPVDGMRPRLEVAYEKPTLYRYNCPRKACVLNDHAAPWATSVKGAADAWNERIGER